MDGQGERIRKVNGLTAGEISSGLERTASHRYQGKGNQKNKIPDLLTAPPCRLFFPEVLLFKEETNRLLFLSLDSGWLIGMPGAILSFVERLAAEGK